MKKLNRSASRTLVIQSHRQPLPFSWLAPCIDSVKNWSVHQGFDYQFLGDDIFEFLPQWVQEKTRSQRVIATDLARLKWMQRCLLAGYQRVVWLDADFLIFAPGKFHLREHVDLPENYRLGREVWVQPLGSDKKVPEKYKVYKKVHNAFLMFSQGNCFLDFYTVHAERLLDKTTGTIPAQFIGPKLLTALHNIVQCPVQENAGMLSPWVIRDILNSGGPALDLFHKKSPQSLAGANLCSSLANSEAYRDYTVRDRALEAVVEKLLSRGSV